MKEAESVAAIKSAMIFFEDILSPIHKDSRARKRAREIALLGFLVCLYAGRTGCSFRFGAVEEPQARFRIHVNDCGD